MVSHIFELYLDGKSYSGIVDALVEEHIPSPRGSERWSKRAIETILTNAKYTGNVEVLKSNPTANRYVLHDAHMAIISTEKFAAVQKQIDKRAKRKRKTESVSKTLVEELKWDKPVDNITVEKSNDEINWSETINDK